MAASKEWTEWHLTPRGWVRGKQMVDFGGLQDSPEPPDAVCVWEHRETISSIYSRSADVSTHKVRDIADAATIAILVAKFGPCPKSL